MGNALHKKILALLRKGRGTDNTNEAESFLAAARRLLEAHGLQEQDLEDKPDNPLGKTVLIYPAEHRIWATAVANEATSYLGAALVSDVPFLIVLGREDRRTTASVMIPYLWKEVMRVAEKEGIKAHNIGLALAARIYNLRMASPARAVRPGELVPTSEALALMEQTFPDVVSKKIEVTLSAPAICAADTISLSLQVEDEGAIPRRSLK